MSKEQDQVFFRNFSIVVGILAVMMVVFIVLARALGIDDEAEMERRANTVSERTAPMGEISVATESEDTGMVEAAAETMDAGMETAVETMDAGMETAATGGESTGADGKATFDSVCAACHGSGIPGIPQFGDAEAWASRIAQGTDTLYANAINGYTGSSGMMMPPRGASPDLTDDQVKAAVDYMVTNSQ